MKVLGLIVEYNPFHNGHIHHIEEAKKKVNPDVTIVVMSGHFVQRGEPAVIDKWTRTSIALQHGIDLVVELPFVYAVQSADYFAKGAIAILQQLQVTDIVFGSESGDITIFKEIAITIKENAQAYDTYVQQYMQQGFRYPDACNKALEQLLHKSITTPNDLLGLAYVKEVIYNGYTIHMHCITRTNDFHSTALQKISSATALRNALLENQDISSYLPNCDAYHSPTFLSSCFPLLQYKLLTTSNTELQQLHLVEEGLENLVLKNIVSHTTMEDFINSLTSKRYTRSRIQRMLMHIAMNNTKKEIQVAMQIDYIRLLGMNQTGQQYLNTIKKNIDFQLVSTFSSHTHPALQIEWKATKLYYCLTDKRENLVQREYKQFPIRIIK